MIKYAKIIDNETKEVSTAASGSQWVISQGYTQMDVEISDVDGKEYLAGFAPMKTDEDKAKEELERVGKLKLTKREVFLGLYQAKGVTPDQIKAQITDPAALIEFEYANDYYRGNPLIDAIGLTLGITPKQLDKFFEFNDYTYLLPIENEIANELVEENSADISEN